MRGASERRVPRRRRPNRRSEVSPLRAALFQERALGTGLQRDRLTESIRSIR